ncbi:G/U mismatch-specific uracil-DNA glycosylase [Peptoclostridium litorale DSM 5388]|uniref:Uracil-DNA glycosylase-like protein n=1 Tax=Peptoclostridium litorale DSM 5388 TaxID=1121324 RepID=A0A069RG31_PEPLI|nr:DNA-deoxyinosine glycosylase [Peptoclostridium litorale]KDR95110.1 uracil-DNA glycosylase-like protein [Peptoclostridium litorale DSM 5388]SIN74852.1 G/U mismatch-specific uracil-DNA glycosylase [Peptoclostridium litorale DSM 5388]
MGYVNSFEPAVDENSKILILGSMPGVESLRQYQYYAHRRNAFWKIMFELLEEEYTEDYELRLNMALKNSIALWDVIRVCQREGSLDSNIKDEEANDFNVFFNKYQGIRHVFFNGKKAYDIFGKKVGFDFEGIRFTRLGSTSPAHAVKFEKKMNDWAQIARALNE